MSSSKMKTYPIEYWDYLLMKDVYHCTPSEFYEQDYQVIEMHKEFRNLENRAGMVHNRRAQQSQRK